MEKEILAILNSLLDVFSDEDVLIYIDFNDDNNDYEHDVEMDLSRENIDDLTLENVEIKSFDMQVCFMSMMEETYPVLLEENNIVVDEEEPVVCLWFHGEKDAPNVVKVDIEWENRSSKFDLDEELSFISFENDHSICTNNVSYDRIEEGVKLLYKMKNLLDEQDRQRRELAREISELK